MYRNQSNKIELDSEPISIDVRPSIYIRFVSMLQERLDISKEQVDRFSKKLCKLLVATEIEMALVTLVVESLNWELSGIYFTNPRY